MLPSLATLAFDLQGHRGARGLWPENTLEGFRAAMDLGVTSIELDVVLTEDGVPVVCHDLALNPDIVRGPDLKWLTAPTRLVASLPAAALAQYDVGRIRPRSRYAARCRGQTPIDGARIPRLDEVVRWACETGMRLDVELKTDRRVPDDSPVLTRLVAAVLEALEAPGCHAAIRSFDWRALRLARELRPEMQVTWLTGIGADATLAAVLASIRQDGWPDWTPGWAPDHRILRRRHVRAATDHGLLVKPWTVNAAFRMRQLLRWGVHGFCTDRPDLAAVIVSGAKRPALSARLPAVFA